jgi:murein DD-endopeptidase MepM/ murein hydrolase activator NlpD
MSPSSSPVQSCRRTRRPMHPPRGRNRPPERVAVSAAVMMAVRSRMPAIKCALVVTAVWSGAIYFASSEDVFPRLIARQAEMQTTYEDRIAELRARVDRIVIGRFLDEKQVEQQVSALLRRQAALEQRALGLTGDLSAAGGLSGMLTRFSLSLDKIEQTQSATLTELEERIDARARRIRTVLADLGIDKGRGWPQGPVGGPFVPTKSPQSGDSAFERQLYRINLACTQIDRYTQTLGAVPVRKPVVGEVDMSSPFGIRRDPFLRRPAFHPGVDLRGDVGEAVRATATGHVTIAGREGGYGNMVEISHGNGLATRYGHLSVIAVKIGQFVRIGEVVGEIGSSGRSTGPHLHYETRVNGEAVDPQKFLRAGLRLGDESDIRRSAASL